MENFMNRLYLFLFGVLVGAALVGGSWFYDNASDHKERVPGITEADVKQLPPAAKNIKSLGNKWLTFDLEDGKETRTYFMKRRSNANQPDVIFPAK